MSGTSRRDFAKAVAAASVALPMVSVSGGEEGGAPARLAAELADVVRAQSGSYLTAEEMERVRADFREYVSLLERLRAFKLVNADEPDFTFVALAKR
ncbi:MAG TPA: hypothetical protein VMS98_00540 [Thermoanaerobaculia bacterium]|nr:hypothetical protein [Thermoanaerobaculia bacterium]